MTAATIDIRANANQAVSEFERLQQRGAASLKGLQNEAMGLQATLGVLAGSAAAVTFVGMVKGAIDSADGLNKLTQRTGIATEQLSAMQYAAQLADVSTEDFSKSIKALNVSIAQGLSGDKEKLALFKQLGVTLTDTNGKVKATQQVLLEVADAYQAHADGAGKVAVGAGLMGKASEGMIPLLNGGSAAIRAQMEEAKALGIVIGADFAQQAEQFNDSMTRMQTGSKAAGLQIATELLPTLQSVVDELNNARKSSDEAGDSFAKKLGGGLSTFVQAASVLAVNVNFVLQGIGREIGGIAAQFAAVGRGDFSQWTAISDAVKADGERARKELEATERRLMGYKESAAGAGRGSVNPGAAVAGGDKPQLKLPGATDSASEYDKLIKQVQERIGLGNQELLLGGQLSEQEKFRAKVLLDLEAAGGKVTAAQRGYIQSMLDASDEVQRAVLVERSAYNDAKTISEQRQKTRNDEYEQARQFLLQLQEEENARMKSAREQLEAIEFETKALGMNTAQREQAIAMRELERQGIKEGTKAWDEYAQKIKDATAARGEKQRLVDGMKAAAEDWKQINDGIYRGLTDSLYRGFEAGKGFGRSFLDSLRNLFKTTVLQVGVNFVTGGSGGWLAQLTGAAPGGGGGGGLGSVNNAMSLGNIASNAKGAYTIGSQVLGGSMSVANAGGTVFANAAGTGIDGLLATNGAYGTAASVAAEGGAAATMGAAAAEGGAVAAGGAAAGGSMAAGLAAIPGWGWAALAVLAIGSQMMGGETRSGAQYVNGNKSEGPSGGEIAGDQTHAAIGGTIASINSGIAALGGTTSVANLYSGLESSENGKGFAYAGAQLSNGAFVGQTAQDAASRLNARATNAGSLSPQEAFSKFTEELKQTTIQALQASDIKGELANWIRSLGNIDAMGGEALDAAYNRIQKALAERAQLQGRLDEMTAQTASAEDRLAKQRDAERAAIDETNRSLLNEIYARQDLAAAAQELQAAAVREANSIGQAMGPLQQAMDAHRAYAQQLRQFAQGLLLGEDSPLGPLAKLGVARYQFDSVSAAAAAGDVDARGRLQGATTDYLGSALGTASSDAEYRVIFATVQGALETTAKAADSQATVAEQQLTALQQQLALMQQQLDATGTLSQTVLTWAQALDKYNAAKAAVDAAVATKDAAANAPAAVVAPTVASTLPALTAWNAIDWLNAYAGNEPTGFAVGGDFAGGARIVGEHGPELEVTGAARIFNARQTQEILSGGGGGSDDTASELRALRQQMERQQAALEAIASRSLQSFKALDELVTHGIQLRDADSGLVPSVKVVA